MSKSSEKPLFRNLDPDEDEPEATVIESLCMNCSSNGTTRLLLTRIPYYKEVILMSFECPDCGFKNNEIQDGGAVEPEGVRITLEIKSTEDLNRQVVKSDFTSVTIPHIQFEIPAKSQKGEITTVEGIISRAIAGLEQDQVLRRIQHPDAAKQIDDFIGVLEKLKTVETPFTMILEDISGNSFVENPCAPKSDTYCRMERFKRTREQDHDLGVFTSEEVTGKDGVLPEMGKETVTLEDLQGEVMSFHMNCPECNAPCDTNMKVTKIPHFKEVVIMATTCDACGHRTNEVKSAGGIEEKGIRIEVKVRGTEDFSRDVLKSETCDLLVPELELDAGSRTLAGKFTTVEGILSDLKEGLDKGGRLFCLFNDSRNDERSALVAKCVGRLNAVLSGEEELTLVLDDPAGNSYVQILTDEPDQDDGVKITRYERTFDQNEELGLNDMKTEGYEEM